MFLLILLGAPAAADVPEKKIEEYLVEVVNAGKLEEQILSQIARPECHVFGDRCHRFISKSTSNTVLKVEILPTNKVGQRQFSLTLYKVELSKRRRVAHTSFRVPTEQQFAKGEVVLRFDWPGQVNNTQC